MNRSDELDAEEAANKKFWLLNITILLKFIDSLKGDGSGWLAATMFDDTNM